VKYAVAANAAASKATAAAAATTAAGNGNGGALIGKPGSTFSNDSIAAAAAVATATAAAVAARKPATGAGVDNNSTRVLVFRCSWNDGFPQHLLDLVAAKNVFSAGLPKMPRAYIARVVMDRNHRTMCVTSHGVVVGGICFRPFYRCT
jgi:hypothetical protein